MKKRQRQKLLKIAYGQAGYISSRQNQRRISLRGGRERGRLGAKMSQGMMGARHRLGLPWVMPRRVYESYLEGPWDLYDVAGWTRWTARRVYFRTAYVRVAQRES